MTITTTRAADGASAYTFDNAARDGEQLDILARILDEPSIDMLVRVGIPQGGRCLDVGPGAGTITTWLAEQVGPTGHVVALDLDPRHITGGNNITIQQGDVRTVDLPPGQFDLIHTRQVLLHLAERDAVVDRLVAALKPGGVLVVSEWDATDRNMLLHAPSPQAATAFTTFQDALLDILASNGADVGWSRRAPLLLRAAGLVDVTTVAHNQLWAGGEAGNLLHVSNSQQLQDALLARGMALSQLELLREAMQDPDTLAYCYWLFTTTGRRPR
ncbi:class I SAM-dependent methyltransferase [Dactylosporangium sp. AC04546]|uniref:class I SAM-dependent methyltransferase n=1 Tax=Dactylosporangium sp. AC04546 TaxID=2862460 RepID=UPI001EE0BDDA|nr:class I SAM-dependent methyltransferase [Dactylosporangium sp. AC04546]WVK78888.1 class I SAM-dependent methyltransferase [Dactylosporangium sp. AC04546]